MGRRLEVRIRELVVHDAALAGEFAPALERELAAEMARDAGRPRDRTALADRVGASVAAVVHGKTAR